MFFFFFWFRFLILSKYGYIIWIKNNRRVHAIAKQNSWRWKKALRTSIWTVAQQQPIHFSVVQLWTKLRKWNVSAQTVYWPIKCICSLNNSRWTSVLSSIIYTLISYICIVHIKHVCDGRRVGLLIVFGAVSPLCSIKSIVKIFENFIFFSCEFFYNILISVKRNPTT